MQFYDFSQTEDGGWKPDSYFYQTDLLAFGTQAQFDIDLEIFTRISVVPAPIPECSKIIRHAGLEFPCPLRGGSGVSSVSEPSYRSISEAATHQRILFRTEFLSRAIKHALRTGFACRAVYVTRHRFISYFDPIDSHHFIMAERIRSEIKSPALARIHLTHLRLSNGGVSIPLPSRVCLPSSPRLCHLIPFVNG